MGEGRHALTPSLPEAGGVVFGALLFVLARPARSKGGTA
jgi:hypothetical protein